MTTHAHAARAAHAPATITLYDPATGGQVSTYEPGREAEIAAALDLAHRSWGSWGALTPAIRSRLLFELADYLSAAQLAATEAHERGIPARQAADEVGTALDVLRFYAAATRTRADAPPGGSYLPGYLSAVSSRPLGVVGAIVPWNYPLLMAIWRCAPALAMGNAVILKPAEETPTSALLLAEAADAVLGTGVLQTVVGDRQTGRLLAGSGRLDGCAFTGSRTAGIDVARAVAPHPVSLELGGNCPAVVFADHPADTALELCTSAYYNGGQSCAAPSRVITTDPAFRDELLALVPALPPPTPLISEAALAKTRNKITRAFGTDRVIAWVQGEAASPDGWHHPAAAAEITPAANVDLRTAETFAPVLTVELVETPGQALALATDRSCRNDLAASVWGTDLDTVNQTVVALARHVGEVWVNCHLVQTPELPHSSAGGVDLSMAALAQFGRPTTITTRGPR